MQLVHLRLSTSSFGKVPRQTLRQGTAVGRDINL